MEQKEYKDTVILYHANCHDGFGAAFAAWKKFGDSASYIPVKYNVPPPEGLAGKNIYVLDFCFEKEVTEKLEALAKSFFVIDHHISKKEIVESAKNHVFDNDHSGAYLSWKHFQGDQIPTLIKLIEEGDLWKYSS